MNLFQKLEQWHRRWAESRDFAALTEVERGQLSDLARDVGIPEHTLAHLISHPDAGSDLEKMMRALGLDPDAVAGTQPLLMRDMALVCAECADVGRCRHAMKDGTAVGDYHDFCPNAAALDALREARAAKSIN